MSSQVPSVAVPTTAEIAGMSPADLEALARRLDGERRRVEAALATLVDRVASAGAFGADGHRSVKAWGRATCNWSGGEASRFVKTGRMLARFESAASAAAAGEIGVAQNACARAVGGQPACRRAPRRLRRTTRVAGHGVGLRRLHHPARPVGSARRH
ncbi:MAG: hypothetical protein K8R99_06580 [Actinomycetia bacterium]|nr:hypothetical protein [Actinomycetes bacterium]